MVQNMSMVMDHVYRVAYPESIFCLSNVITECTAESRTLLLAGQNIKIGLLTMNLIYQALDRFHEIS